MSISWLALSVLLDGVNTLVLPLQISKLTNQETQATALGLLTTIGLFAGALIQPIAGALYIVDFGIIHIAPERGGIRQQMDTGALWRIRRISGSYGFVPPQPKKVPLYLLQGLALLVAILGIGVLTVWLLKRLGSQRK